MDLADQGMAAGAALGLTELAKITGLPSRFAPLLSVIFAVAITLMLVDDITREAIVYGILSGLAASGLYSGVKTQKAP